MTSPLAAAEPGATSCQPNITVSQLNANHTGAWDDFVKGCKDATFFHLSGWKMVIEKAFGHATFFLYAEAAGKIIGVLPLAQIKSKLFGHALSSLPFGVYGGIAADTPVAYEALDAAAQS